MKLRISGYFKKLILFALVICTIPVMMLGGFLYYKSSQVIQKKVNEANMQVLVQTQITVEQAMKSIHNSSIRLANSAIVTNSIGTRYTYSNYKDFRDIQDQLATLDSQQVGESSFLYSSAANWSISVEGITEASKVLKNEDSSVYSNQPSSSFWMREKSTDQSDSSKYIRLVTKIPLNSVQPLGYLIVRIPGEGVNKLILKSGSTGSVMILDENQDILSSDSVDIVEKTPSMEKLKERIKQSGNLQGRFNLPIGDDTVGVNYIVSKYNQWTYLSIVSLRDITKESRDIGIATVVISLLVLMLAYGISLMGSYRMYNPVKKLYKYTKGDAVLQDGAKKGVDEFAYIAERINNFTITQTEMAKQLRRQVENLEEFFILKLLNGEIKEEEIREGLNSFGYKADWKWLCVLSVQIDTFENTRYEEKDRDLMLFAINNIISELTQEDARLRPVLTGRSQVTILGGTMPEKEEFKQYVYSRAEEFQKSIKQYLNLKVSIGISRFYTDFKDVAGAYRESIDALKYRVKLGLEAILFIEDVLGESGVQLIYPEHLEEKLIDAIKMGEPDMARETMEQLIEEIFKNPTRLYEYQVSLLRLLVDILRLVQDSGKTIQVLGKENRSFMDSLFELNSKEEILNWFMTSVITPVMQLLEEQRSEKQKFIAGEVIRMIHEEYDKDLSIEECAQRLHYHPSYIWRVLRKEAGINFSDYLAQYRFTIAKKWLEETEMTVKEIAERLKYSNAQNFIRYFRKIEGVAPGKYRESFKKPEA